ncbi:hypothetical protein AK830_g3307 [Neonectria ditissima]|uniref:Xylanolytic transcriptional activator regulatory domain-containing protein n=1 Tax=Neonectria ditissima TaxID=78410 RepID=A0A0P7BQI4_9HYPO|nr:hypothetical protein AK830_g3307 [Neonectria ditissima]
MNRIPPEALERPDKKLADRLIRAYFDNVNRGWPIVDEDWFMHQNEGRNPRNPVPLALLNAVFLVGAHVLSAQDGSMRQMQKLFFYRAKTLVDYRLEQDRVMYVQVALLLTWYSDGLEEVVANAWYWIGIATRTAFGISMNRDITHSRMQSVHKRVYTRLWWVLFQFDTIASASCGRPQVINVDDSDVPELKHSDFKGIPEAAADFTIHQTKLCLIISRTMREGWALRSSPERRIQAVKNADEALAQLLTDLPPKLSLSVVHLDTWRSILHLTYNNFVILLHRAPPRHSTRDRASVVCSDPSLCGGAADAIGSIFDALLNRGELCTMWLYSNHVLFTAIVHVGGELDSANPLVAARSQRVFESLLSALRGLSRYRRYAQGLLQLFEQRALRVKKSQVRAGGSNLRPSVWASEAHFIQHPTTTSTWSDLNDHMQARLATSPLGMDLTDERPSFDAEPSQIDDTECYWGSRHEPPMGKSRTDSEQGRLNPSGDGVLDDLFFLDESALNFFLGEADDQPLGL